MNKILHGDVLETLGKIPKESIHLIVTSPPYNVGIEYLNHDDNMPHKEYLAWMKEVWKSCKEVLVPGGRICINIDATMNLEEGDGRFPERVHPLHVDFTNQLRELGYIYRAEVNWCKHNAPGKDTAWGSYCIPSNPHIRRNTEYVIIASKDTLTLSGDSMMSDITKEEFHEWTLSEWRITPETKKNIHPVKFPRELVLRCIKLFSFVGNTVLDPFNGSGTTTSTAFELGRKFIGIDNCEEYCRLARNNIKELQKEFEINGPYVFKPSPTICAEAKAQKMSNNKRNDLFE